MQKPTEQKDVLEYAKEALPLIVVVVSVIFSWAYFQFNLSSHERRLTAIEKARSSDQESISAISGDVKAINAKLDLILEKRLN